MTESLNKDNIMNMSLSLDNLVSCLEQAFQEMKIERYANQNLVMAIGNTGCGKSTMLSSLLFGPESLKLSKIEK